jgi:putative chitinase
MSAGRPRAAQRRDRYAYRLGWRSVRYVCPHLTVREARVIADALGPAFAASGITTARRASMAVAQFAHESDGFRTTTEYASGQAYEGREDLGNTQPGDGRRFKGRGFVQITGRANYALVSARLAHDFVRRPTDLALPRWAAKASAVWWRDNGCNQIADTGDFVALTRRINGGVNGLADRERLYRRARRAAPFLVPKRRKP